MKHFIHHPKNTRIDVRVVEHQAEAVTTRSSSLGVGGLAFLTEQEISPGTRVQIKVPYPRIKSDFIIEGKVVWCRKRAHGSALGIDFLSDGDAFSVRMFEQICHIENYRLEVSRNEGRTLTAKDAAIEWVAKYSADFPNPGTESVQ